MPGLLCTKAGSMVGVFIQFVGIMLHIVGVSTPKWSSVVINNKLFGLWKTCKNNECEYYSYSPLFPSLRACAAMAVIGLLVSIVAIATAGFDLFNKFFGKVAKLPFHLISAASSIVSLFFISLAITVWGTDIHDLHLIFFNIGYSFILSLVGGVFIAIGGLTYGIFNMRTE